MGSDVEQRYSLLRDDENCSVESDLLEKRHADWSYRLYSPKFIIPLLLYSLLVTATAIYLAFPWRTSSLPYTPAGKVLKYQNAPAEEGYHSIYGSKPSSKVDEAWNDLVSPIHFQATDEELRLSNNEPDATVSYLKGGYFSTIGVYHELHCLRRLYWLLHEDYYFPNRTSEGRRTEREHATHCLTIVLKNTMCTPNTALYSFTYNPETDPIPVLVSGAERQCIEWEPFHQWASSRSMGLDPDLLAPKKLREEMGIKGETLLGSE